MHALLAQCAALVRGLRSGCDRLCFGGTLRHRAHGRGRPHYLGAHRIPSQDCAAHRREVTARREEAARRPPRHRGREIRSRHSAPPRQADIAHAIAARDRLTSGLICVLRRVAPCRSFPINKNYRTHQLEIRCRPRQGRHLDHYQIHPVFGFRHTRLPTGFPFRRSVCRNGRAGRTRPLDQAQRPDVRRDNPVPGLEDLIQAPARFAQQLQAHGPTLRGGLAQSVHPAQAQIGARSPGRSSGSVRDRAGASDVRFRDRAAWAALAPRRRR